MSQIAQLAAESASAPPAPPGRLVVALLVALSANARKIEAIADREFGTPDGRNVADVNAHPPGSVQSREG